MSEKPRLAISFSGGRTSAYMMALCLKKYGSTHDIQIVFANTGCEHSATLDFVDKCDRHIAGGSVVWVEAVISPIMGEGIRHREVDYLTADRNGKPFYDLCAKYGIPNQTSPTCTNYLKRYPIESYLRSVGFIAGKKRNYAHAIGIRYDEADRISDAAISNGFIYPLVTERIIKGAVIEFWKNQPFDLQIPGEHYGNCVWCWKKSRRKLLTVAKYNPELFDFPIRVETELGHVGAEKVAGKDGRRTFFRGHTTAKSIVIEAKTFRKEYIDARQLTLFDLDYDDTLDVGGGCGESCEIGADSYADSYQEQDSCASQVSV